jgi:hypothetical protein
MVLALFMQPTAAIETRSLANLDHESMVFSGDETMEKRSREIVPIRAHSFKSDALD